MIDVLKLIARNAISRKAACACWATIGDNFFMLKNASPIVAQQAH